MAAPMARLNALVDAGVQTHVRGNSVWIGNPGIKIRDANGVLTPAGERYEQLMEAANQRAETRVFHHAAQPVVTGGVERVRDRAGSTRVLRQWDPSLNGGRGGWRFTQAGERFHGRVRFDVEVPVWGHETHERRGDRRWPDWLPMTDDALVGEHALPGDMGAVRDANTLQAQAHFIEEALRAHFARSLQEGEVLFRQSDVYYTYRPEGEFKINYQGVRFHDHRAPTVETVLGRPLHGQVVLPIDMLWVLDLEEVAHRDYQGKCVRHQLMCVKRRNQGKEVPKWGSIEEVDTVLHYLQFRCHGGRREPPYPVSADAKAELEAFLPAWRRDASQQQKFFMRMEPRSIEETKDFAQKNLGRGYELAESFAAALRRVFPTLKPEERYRAFFRSFPECFYCRGDYVLGIWDHEAVEESEPAAPYDKGDWTEVGVTSWMVGELGTLMRRAVYVIHNDRKVYVFRENVDDHEQAIVYNVWGDHFLLYQDGKCGRKAEALPLEPRLNTPLLKLATRHDDEMPRVQWGQYFGLEPLEHMILLSILLQAQGKKQAAFVEDRLRKTFVTHLLCDGDKIPPECKCDQAGRDAVWTEYESLYETVQRAQNWKQVYKARPLPVYSEDMTWEEQQAAQKAYHEEIREQLRDRRLSVAELLLDRNKHPRVLWTTDLPKLQRELQLNGVHTRASWSSPETISALRYRLNKRKSVTIHREPHDAQFLDTLCELAGLHYHGESSGVVLLNLLNARLASRRKTIVNRKELADAHDGKCSDCGHFHRGRFEVHHILALRDGGTDEPKNLKVLCTACHLEYTRERDEQGQTGPKPLVSRLSPTMAEQFRATPKPRVWHSGSGDTKRDVTCLDLVGCRRNALCYGVEVPVFTPADHPEEGGYEATHHFFYVDADVELDGFDAMLYDGRHWYPRVTTAYMLELGIVPPESVKYRFKAGRTVPADFLRRCEEETLLLWKRVALVLRMGGDSDTPAEEYERRKHILYNMGENHALIDVERQHKDMWNAFLGVCSTNPRLAWSVVESVCLGDMGRVDVLSLTKNGVPQGKACTEVVGVETLYPLSLSVLGWETVTMHRTTRQLLDLGAKLIGWNTDGIFIKSTRNMPDLRELLALEHAEGKPVFRLKATPRELVPTHPQAYARQDREFAPTKPWTVLREDEVTRVTNMAIAARECYRLIGGLPIELVDVIGDFADHGLFSRASRGTTMPELLASIILHNGGALITGGPGTGKTVLEKAIIAEAKRVSPHLRIITCAQTHAACRLMPNGETLAHVLHHEMYGNVAETLLIVDEASMIGLGAWSVIAEWKLLGCIIVVLGDFEGQFLPIADSYGPDIRVDRLDIMRQVANSLHVKLTVPKRFEEAHFAWVMSKYPLADGPFTEAHAAEVRARFPYRGEPIDLYIAISHRDRRSLNALANERDRHGGVLVRCVPASGANLPQDMWLRPGMVLLGCSRSCAVITNGVPYAVLEATQHVVKVKMVPEYRRDLTLSVKQGKAREREALNAARQEQELVLSHAQASKWLRLPYCVTYRSAQGITARNKRVMLMSLDKRAFDVRSLIVGTSRVTNAALLHVATANQERDLLASCPAVPEPPTSPPSEAPASEDD